jgi:hypothetical protein
MSESDGAVRSIGLNLKVVRACHCCECSTQNKELHDLLFIIILIKSTNSFSDLQLLQIEFILF